MTDVRNAFKKKDAWWTVYLVDPVAARLMLPLANHTRITPNQLTLSAFACGLISAFCFYRGTYSWILAGAVLYHLSFTLDCMDGKVSRLKGTGSVFGAWLDYALDRTRVAICAFALMLGQYGQTGDIAFFYLAALVCFLDSTRYMNSLLVYKSLNTMRHKLGADNSEEFLREVIARHPSYLPIRTFLLKRRVRLHLVSGIEFQMFVFILAPVFGLIPEGTVASSILMVLFESAVIYKLWLMTLDYRRQLRSKLEGA
ncbi:CDP-alcohol phosphatidyltransferase family protein [Cohnella sp. CFH 77786]|nr:CDP-alcohol phosphatidyltransferase family protein [Cohnella sp. CFH 77786]